jgi:aminoglycoside phosphotransferase (APT) family kinase protein
MNAPLDRFRRALAAAGIPFDADSGAVEPRDGKMLLRLPGHRLAWLAETEVARARIERERRVLSLLGSRCTFGVPRVVHVGEDGAFDVRMAVPGLSDPWAMYERAKSDASWAARIGREIGAVLAEQHTRIAAADVAAWLPRAPGWPERRAWIVPRVERVTGDAALTKRVDALIARHESLDVPDEDRVLVHGDLGFHNLAFDRDTLSVRGVFDWDDASFADPHHDFRYLLFDFDDHGEALLDAAIEVYEAAAPRRISRERVALYNACCAATFLAFREGKAPDEDSCGRTLAQDLDWTRGALARAGM